MTLLATETGKQFRFQVLATNAEGSSLSKIASFYLADKPSKPTIAPVQNGSTNSSLSVLLSKLSELEASNLPILGYELQIDDGLAGSYATVEGYSLQTDYEISNLQMGSTYRLRYRVQNLIGLSDWSEPSLMLVAVSPARPPMPILQTVDETEISVLLPST
jgi:hypothetical protein